MKSSARKNGFSTVELLVAIFVGAAFIGVGYQLYGLIVRDGASARQQSMASDLAYQILRQKSAEAPDTCGTPATSNISTTNPGLPTPFSVTMTTVCPYPTSGAKGGAITSYTIKVTYGSQEVSHAIYATRASGN